MNSKKEALELSEMAFEYLLDPIMKFCETTKDFPAVYDVLIIGSTDVNYCRSREISSYAAFVDVWETP